MLPVWDRVIRVLTVYGEFLGFYTARILAFETSRLGRIVAGRARNNGRSTDNVRPECGVVRSIYLAGHFDRSLSVKEQTNLYLN
jgi:hypothetical protein